ncbi:stage II sporulation protein D [Clostridium sp. MSJ-4]|uniref:Stage II sporulation protein D n=1 Tax=Clostridium simiarum TaxID=2841506 RepID=A0ABS6EVS1_9CLOT|nr:stage II sporulation protein D [Clostridium simiarum]MBU5590326.1 stage II sporulation protein D [Clostridium simiarum]
MNKVNINIEFKKLIICFILFILFIIIMPIIFIGIGDKEKNHNNIKGYEGNEKINYSKNSLKGKEFNDIKVHNIKKGEFEEINLEEYIVGVVASEMPANFNEDALKAQAVAARTFAVSKMILNCKKANGADICDTTHCQVYVNKEEKIKSWPKDQGEGYWGKIEKAVMDTKGEILMYEGNLVLNPQYFAVSSGKTEDASEVFSFSEPYLISVESSGEEVAPKFKSKVTFSNKEFVNKINQNYKDSRLEYSNLSQGVKIISRSKGGSVKSIKIGDVNISGPEFRKVFNLNSANFTISFIKDKVEINCLGYGHGVGMSQWGANSMGKDGKNYRDILTHYYQGVSIEKIND